jgi:toxin-antitoxin system PIN domain toxin
MELLTQLSEGPELITFFWPVLLGYIRIVTNPRMVSPPLSTAEAMSSIDSLLARPNARAVGELDGFWLAFREMAGPVSARGGLVTDAHIAALMRQHGVREIWTHDRDFRKFDGIVVRDPFAS